MIIANLICYALVIIGALNWGLVGFFDFNLVSTIFGGYRTAGAIVIYSLIFAAALWLIISPFITRGRLYLCEEHKKIRKTEN